MPRQARLRPCLTENTLAIGSIGPRARTRERRYAGKLVCAKRALKQQQVWAIRFLLDRERRVRDRALFDLAIDSELCGCDVVKIKIGEFVSGGHVRARAIVMQQKTEGRSSSRSWSPLEPLSWLGSSGGAVASTTSPFQAVSIMPPTSALGSTPGWSTNGSFVSAFMRRTMARTPSDEPRHRSSTSGRATCAPSRSCSGTPRLRAQSTISVLMSKTP